METYFILANKLGDIMEILFFNECDTSFVCNLSIFRQSNLSLYINNKKKQPFLRGLF